MAWVYVRSSTATPCPAHCATCAGATPAASHVETHACRRARRCLDDAAAILGRGDGDTLPYVFLGQGDFARWRGNCLAAVGDREATAILVDALETLDPTFSRAAACGLLCDDRRRPHVRTPDGLIRCWHLPALPIRTHSPHLHAQVLGNVRSSPPLLIHQRHAAILSRSSTGTFREPQSSPVPVSGNRLIPNEGVVGV